MFVSIAWISYVMVILWPSVNTYFHKKSMIRYDKPTPLKNDALFGFSVAYQSFNRSLIVGTPRGSRIGKIYIINVDTSEIAEEHHDLLNGGFKLQEYWLGATVKAGSDFYLTCAPRVAEQHINPYNKKESVIFTGGVCLKKRDSFSTLASITHSDLNYNTSSNLEKFTSFGWSIELTSNQDDALIGGPAMFIGRVLHYKHLNEAPSLVHNTITENPVRRNYGYSVTSGNFFSDERVYAISTTFGNVGYGKVYLFNSKFKTIHVIENDELGSMFGAAMCAATLRGAVLLVGAPAHAADRHSYDVGAVYVFGPEFKGSNRMVQQIMVKGTSNGGYFGHTIINLGDMDGDKNDEIAIAAPYIDDGRGAVYIYSGAGLLNGDAPIDKIQAEGFRSFGYSLAILQDYNENGCNELAVGAPESNCVFLLMGIAAIKVFLESSIQVLEKNDDHTKFIIKSCINIEYPEKPTSVSADLHINVKLTDPYSKFITESDNSYNYDEPLTDRRLRICRNIKAINPKPIKEFGRVMIAYEIKASLKEDPQSASVFNTSKVTLSGRSKAFIAVSEWITECGKARAPCTPDFTINISSTMAQPYMIGSTQTVTFDVSILNSGDTTYTSCVEVAVLYQGMDRNTPAENEVLHVQQIQPPPDCISIDNRKIQCKHKSPIHNGSYWNITELTVATKTLSSLYENLKIELNVFNHCSNRTDVKSFTNTYKLISDSDKILISGQSNPEDLNFNRKNIDKVQILEHSYTIINNGVTNWIGLPTQIILANAPYVKISDEPIKIYTKNSNAECATQNTTQTNDTVSFVSCNIADLQPLQLATVIVTMEVLPNTLELDKIKDGVNITTTLLLLHDRKYFSLNTTLRHQEGKVDLWIIILSCIIGLFLIILAALVLYKCGFLRRKNKEKLNILKREVYRQSVRRSMMKDTMRAAANN